MYVGETTFSLNEIVELLKNEGIKAGSKQFSEEVSRRFYPIDDGMFVERPDWEPAARDQFDHRHIDAR